MNCLIETLSLIRKLPDEPWSFRVADEEMLPTGQGKRRFVGMQTNEAPTKYFLSSLAARGEIMDRILLIVSRECMEERPEALNGRNTYEFFRDAITAYLGELAAEQPAFQQILDERWGGSTSAYLDAALVPVSVPERMDPSEWRDIINSLYSFGDKKIKLYFDFTGGSRAASLISLLLLGIMKSVNAEVRQVIYGDIQNKLDPKLVDCTKSYGILKNIEEIAGAFAEGKNRNAKIAEVLEQYGIISPEAAEIARENDKTLEREEDNLRLSSERTPKPKQPKPTKNPKLVSAVQQHLEQTAKDAIDDERKKTPFQKLIGKKNDEVIKLFYEEIYLFFLDYHVFISSLSKKDAETRIPNLLNANDRYYEVTTRSGQERGVIPKTKEWLALLLKHPNYRPVMTFELRQRIDSKEYVDLVKHWAIVKGVSSDHTRKFEEYLLSQGTDPNMYSFGVISDWERAYYNYGFPFMSMDVKSSEYYPEIMDYYLTLVRSLMEKLEALSEKNRSAYQRELCRLLNSKEALKEEIPYMIEFENVSFNRKGFPDTEAADAFIKTLCARFEKARPYRNAIAHRSNNEYSKPDNQKRMAEEIRAWLREYEKAFPEPLK